MSWTESCAYNQAAKTRFHKNGRQRLLQLAKALGFEPGTYDIRSNKGGIAVSGEITLHHDRVYVQIGQWFGSPGNGVLIRTCAGRKDYVGGRNNFAPFTILDDMPALVARVQSVMNAPAR